MRWLVWVGRARGAELQAVSREAKMRDLTWVVFLRVRSLEMSFGFGAGDQHQSLLEMWRDDMRFFAC
jgi:hypothetical protein